MGVKGQPRKLLASVQGLDLVEMRGTEECCGFGGTFCVKYPEISTKMVDDKIAHIQASGAGTVLGGDLGCLLNIAGRIKRRGLPIRVLHTAEVLAGMGAQPSAIRRAGEARRLMPAPPPRANEPLMHAPPTPSRARLGRHPRQAAAGRARPCQRRLRAQACRAGGGAAGIRGAARARPRPEEPRARPPGHLPRTLRRAGHAPRRPGALGRHRRRGARASSSTSAARPTPRPSPRASRWSARRSA